jgi:hypothetical protein
MNGQLSEYLFDCRNSDRIERSAEVSECGRYRWWLRRSWSLWNADGTHRIGKGVVSFIMLNPSTADALQDDPTIRRCIGFAKSWGFNTLSVRNLFPWRATDPKELFRAETVTGGHRGDVELTTALTADLVVAAWGANVPFKRDAEAIEMFVTSAPMVPIYCLGTTKNGSPRHPLYVKADQQPVLFQPASF